IPQVKNAYLNFTAKRGVSELKWFVFGSRRSILVHAKNGSDGSGRCEMGINYDKTDRNEAWKIDATTFSCSFSAIPPLWSFFRSLNRFGTVDWVYRVRSYDLATRA
ncbi:hypothetical protein A2U01_0060608, partial [Trifolium medium]|nr:hypothetical protein [Trifolium medium]